MNTRIPRFIRGQYEKINSTYYKENLSINFHHGKGWIWRTGTGQKIGVLLTNEKEIFDHHVDCEFEFYSEGMSEFFTSSVLAVENNSDLSPGSLIFIQEPSLKSYMNGFYMEVRRSDKIRNLKMTTVNRYKRGLETCPQAKTSKSGHAFFFSFFPSRPLLEVFACIG